MKRLAFLILIPVSLLSFQIIRTQLTITVRNELGNLEEGATVMLFENEQDHKSEKNAVAESVTDKKGIARFRNLKPITYYIIARKEDRDNTGGGEKTSPLEEKRINRITVIIQ